jgi:hypothetical protein
MKVEILSCPSCSAPLSFTPQQSVTICLYCNSSIRITSNNAGNGQSRSPAQTVAQRQEIDPAIIESIKQLVVDGKRLDAIRQYEEAAAVTRAEAETAIDKIIDSLMGQLTRQIPLNLIGITVPLLILTTTGAGAVWSLLQLFNGRFLYILPVLLLAFLFVRTLRTFIPRATSTWVARFGRLGQATVLRTAVIRSNFHQDGSLIVIFLEIQPGSNYPLFCDQETLLVSPHSLARLQPGNVIQVRFNPSNLEMVFPVTPIQVMNSV